MSLVACSHCGCDRSSLRRILEAFRCSLCSSLFCFAHRMPEEHHCRAIKQKEEARLETVRRHEQLIARLVPEARRRLSCSPQAPLASFSSSSNEGRQKLGGECGTPDMPPVVSRRANNGFSNDPPTSRQRASSSSATVERIKLRLNSVGDPSVALHDRVHVIVRLGDGVVRGGDDRARSRNSALLLLPSQRRKPVYASSLRPEASQLLVWLDGSKSVGWSADFLARFFKLRFEKDAANPRPVFTLYLGSEALPEAVPVADVIADGTTALEIRYRNSSS